MYILYIAFNVLGTYRHIFLRASLGGPRALGLRVNPRVALLRHEYRGVRAGGQCNEVVREAATMMMREKEAAKVLDE